MAKEIKGGEVALSTDINVITTEIKTYQRVAGEAIFEIGRRLKHVKENDLVHGEFGEWAKSIGMDGSIVRKFIRIVDELGANRYTYTDLGMNALYHIATMPEEARTETHTLADGTEKKPEDMTIRELREAKRALKDAEKEKEEAERIAKQAEAQADLSQRSEENMRRQLEEFESGTPEVEIRTEYVEVESEKDAAEIEKYRKLFGDISIYDGAASEVTNGEAITYTVFEFSKDVRKFIEKFGHLTHFAREFNEMIDEGKEEYKHAINDMYRFLSAVERNLDEVEATIING